MRDIATKVNLSTSLDAGDWNATEDELERAVGSADINLDPAGGPDTDLDMLGKTMAAYANAGWGYTDSGTANAHVVSIASNLKPITKYYDNLIIAYLPGNTNTSVTVNVNVQGLGNKEIRIMGGTVLSVGDIKADKPLILKYNVGFGFFEIISGGMGEWDSGGPWAKNTSYLAVTDGFVLCSSDGDGILYGKTDGSSPPTTTRTANDGGADSSDDGLCFPVRKGDFWLITSTSSSISIYWLPVLA
jgi:hypothetical protein